MTNLILSSAFARPDIGLIIEGSLVVLAAFLGVRFRGILFSILKTIFGFTRKK